MFSHPKSSLEHLAQALDDKFRMQVSFLKKARDIDHWGLFAMRDDAVSDFLKKHMAPTLATSLVETTALLAQRRKRWLVNGYLADMLGPAEGAQCEAARYSSEALTCNIPRVNGCVCCYCCSGCPAECSRHSSRERKQE